MTCLQKLYSINEETSETLEAIFNYLKDLEINNSGHNIYYFGGCDNNEAGFVSLSNNLEICVKAKNELVGDCLLRLLHGHINGFASDLDIIVNGDVQCDDDLDPNKFYPISEIIDRIQKQESYYSISFDPMKEELFVKRKFCYIGRDYVFSKCITDVRCWDIDDIMEAYDVDNDNKLRYYKKDLLDLCLIRR